MIEIIGGPDRDRTDDLFHAMEARSQLRHRPTLRKNFLYSRGLSLIRQTPSRFEQLRTALRELIAHAPVSK